MSPIEIAQERERAEDLARSVGGAIAAILGLRPTGQTITWDARRARFKVGSQTVSLETIRRELHRFETQVGVRMSKLATALTKGSITLPEWRSQMKELVGSAHAVMAGVAAGSIAASINNPAVQRKIDSEKEYVDGFAQDIKDKDLKRPTIAARSRSYLLAAAVTFSVVGLAVHKLAGYGEARRITTAAESCPDCRSYAFEWLPIDSVPAIGSLACGNRCRCYLEYR